MQKIGLKDYLARKAALLRSEKPFRVYCGVCKKTEKTCFCSALTIIEPITKFIILIHKEEARRAVATGRMAHLSLKHSLLFKGNDFSKHEELNRILDDKGFHCVLLYPGKKAVKLEELSKSVDPSKKLVVILLDATWHEARKMYRLSTNLHALQMVSFIPDSLSQFQVRKQPKVNCYSTFEAIHYVLTRIEPSTKLDGLLSAFEHMVKEQLEYGLNGGGRVYDN